MYAWAFPVNESNPPSLEGSATDGDVDIAYALLCAAKKWNDNNYKNRAIEIINALETLIQVPSEWYFLVTGDWTLEELKENERLKRITRPSDFALAEFRAFTSYETNSIWSCVLEDAVSFVSRYQRDYSPNCGLVADWMEWNIQKSLFVEPDEKFIKDNFGEDDARKYSWNACRVPFRFAVDALLYNNTRAKETLKPLVDFMIKQAKTQRYGRITYDVSRIKAGYTMSGSAIVNYDDASFWAPVVAAAKVFANRNNEYKAFMDACYPKVRDSFDGIPDSYYDDSIALLCLILLNDLWYNPLK